MDHRGKEGRKLTYYRRREVVVFWEKSNKSKKSGSV